MFTFQVLASGSSGNSFLLRTGKTALLLDAGLHLRTLEKYLRAEGLEPSTLTAVLLSHEHRDHCVGARDLAETYRAPVWSNSSVLRATGLHDLPSARVLEVDTPTLFGDVEVTCFSVQHDAVCPVGFRLRVDGRTITIATDLGQPTDDVVACVSEADLIVLEANHDLAMLDNGRYSHYLRRRVSGPTGHLSNTQAAGILATYVKSENTEVWLAHLSKENNTAALAVRTVRHSLRLAGLATLTLGVALRDRPSLRWTGQPAPRQLPLFPEDDKT